MTMPFGRKLGMEVSSRVAVVGLVVLALDTSCNPRREHTEVTQGGQGPQADRESKVPSCRLDPPGDGSECILPRSCVGVPGYCFVLKEEHRPGSATEAEEHTGLGDPRTSPFPGRSRSAQQAPIRFPTSSARTVAVDSISTRATVRGCFRATYVGASRSTRTPRTS